MVGNHKPHFHPGHVFQQPVRTRRSRNVPRSAREQPFRPFWYDDGVKRLLLVLLLVAGSLAATYAFFESHRERNYRRLIDSGEESLARGHTSAAIEAFSGAVALKSRSMLGYLRRGEAYRRRDELDAALRDLLHASRLDPAAPRPLELLGDVNASLLRYDRAAARYRAYLAIDDQSPRVLYKLGLVHHAAGRPAEGAAVLRQALAFSPRFPEAQYLLGLCLRDLHQDEGAIAALANAIRQAPMLLTAREELAELYGRAGRTQDRLIHMEWLAALDPRPSRTVALATAYFRAGYSDRAVPTLQQTIERHPDDSEAHLALGRVWLESAEREDDDQALSQALQVLKAGVRAEDTSEALTLWGRALLLSGNHELAERMLQDATTRQPVDPEAFLYLSEAAERRNRPDAARQALLHYLVLKGDDRQLRGSVPLAARIAALAIKANDPQAAVTWYQRAVEEGGADAPLLVGLAEAQERAGDTAGARLTLQAAIDRDPDNPAARAVARRLR
jgi:tetratricopeptide (TPR) repeat protein